MKRQPSGGKRTLPKRLKKPANVPGLPPAVIGGVPGGHVCQRCGRTVPADEMTAGGQNCRDCGHPAHLRELEKKRQQRARVRSQLIKAMRDRTIEGDELEELIDEAVELHGSEGELARAFHDDYRAYPGGSPRRIQHLQAIFRLVAERDRRKPTFQEILETLSDEELDLAIRALSDEVLAELTQAVSATETAGAGSS